MKRTLSVIIISVTLILLFTGCTGQRLPGDTFETEPKKLNIVTTIFAAYDWAKELTNGTNANVTLLNSDADMHNYKASEKDIREISKADVFIYTGGESDDWAREAIKSSNTSAKTLSLVSVLNSGIQEETSVSDAEQEVQTINDEVRDEHVWLSLRNAEVLVDKMASVFSAADENNKVIYANNADAYIQRLKTVDEEYKRVMETIQTKTLVFGDCFPFRYLANDYGLECYAAFDKCSAETEISSEKISYLASVIDDKKLGVIYKIDGSDGKIAEAVRNNTQTKAQQIVSLNSMQSKQKTDATYVSIMEDNLSIFAVTLWGGTNN